NGICTPHTQTGAGGGYGQLRRMVSGKARLPFSGRYHTGTARRVRRGSVGMMPSISLALLVLVGIASPAALLVLLGCGSLLNRPLKERWTGPIAAGSMMTACAALSAALVVYGVTGTSGRLLSFGAWATSAAGG